MKKKLISVLLALAMVFSLTVPALAIGPENVLPAAVEGVITLDKDYGVENTTEFNFNDQTLTLNLNGHKLLGKVINAANVTVENKVPTQVPMINSVTGSQELDADKNPVFNTEDIDTPAYLLGAIGTYANDVSKYAADGYDAKAATGSEVKNTIFNNEDNSNFKVVVEVTPDNIDRDASNEDIVDIFADEYVNVTVKVTGARYASADITLTWDTSLFSDETASWDLDSGWVGAGTDGFNGGFSSYRFTAAHDNDEYYEDGEVIGHFTFRALYIDEGVVKSKTFYNKAGVIAANANERGSYSTFTVKNDSHRAKVIGSWRKAKEDGTTTPLEDSQLEDGAAHIILMDAMTGDVSAKTGLIYKATEQNLLDTTYNNNTGFSALVGGVEPEGNDGNPSAKVQTVVMTKAAYEDLGSIAPAYGDADVKLTANDIQAVSAGDYVVCYKISAPGYASVTGVKNINIAKQAVDLVWVAPDSFDTSSEAGIEFEGNYSSEGFNAPTATYTDLNNGPQSPTVNLTAGPNGPELKAVGNYTFTAADDPNYEFNNPTCAVKVNGLTITGWTLKATNHENTGTDVINGVIWRDGEERPIGYLDVADNASFKKDTDGKYYTTGETKTEVTNVVVKYEWSEGKYYTTLSEATAAGKNIGDEIWTKINATDAYKVAELGKYKLRMTVSADNYETMSQTVNFEIKNPIFVVENLEYVAGYSIVLVYTNETGVSFKYGSGGNAIKMYDVTGFGYKYNNNNYGNGSVNYAHVYEIVIKGAADVSMVYASNEAAKKLTLPSGYLNVMPTGDGYKGNKYVNDVNNKATAQVDLDDITAVQSIYNVNAGNMLDMEVVIRSDVNRDKMVDNQGDVVQVMAYYLNPPVTT